MRERREGASACARLSRAGGPGSPRLCRPSPPAWRGEIPTSLPRCVREEMPLFFSSFCMCVCKYSGIVSISAKFVHQISRGIPPFNLEKSEIEGICLSFQWGRDRGEGH